MNRRLFEVRKSLVMTQKDMADVLSIGQSAYSMIERGHIGLTQRNRETLKSKLRINPEFLLEGSQPMILPNNTILTAVGQKDADVSATSAGARGVPYISKAISSTSDTPLRFSPSDIEYYIDYEPFNDCAFYRPVFGYSMAPRFNPGDTVACKAVKSHSNILYGHSYLCVVSNEGETYETLQILRKTDNESEVALTPLNPAFDSVVIPLSSIVELYLVCGKIERVF
ncbi:MAG: S24 family peptidase [Rikenellaceae bacterium]